jgi:hypothetical protein
MNLKPCIECGKECEIWPIQLGDLFTLCHLRVCGGECLFLIAYDYLYEIGYHKQFRGKLYDLENEEDAALRKEFVDMITEKSLQRMREDLKASPNLLSTPAPNGLLKIFEGISSIPQNAGKTMKFTRPSIENRIQWAKEHVERIKMALAEALKDLEKVENE